MEFKFLMFAIMLAIFPIPTEASSKTCPHWVKLNSRPSALAPRETSLVVFPTIETSSWARSCSCTARENCHVINAPTVTGDANQITEHWLCSWLIRTTRYLLQKRKQLMAVDGINWPDTALPRQSWCSVPQRSLNVWRFACWSWW